MSLPIPITKKIAAKIKPKEEEIPKEKDPNLTNKEEINDDEYRLPSGRRPYTKFEDRPLSYKMDRPGRWIKNHFSRNKRNYLGTAALMVALKAPK